MFAGMQWLIDLILEQVEVVPAGVIAEWYGSLGSIPSGWVLCDGANGTPDLRNNFIVGAGDTFNPGDTGGVVEHNHYVGFGGHTHSLIAGTDLGGAGERSNVTDSHLIQGYTYNAGNYPPYHSLAFIMKT